jgi:hypothetical protein
MLLVTVHLLARAPGWCHHPFAADAGVVLGEHVTGIQHSWMYALL